MSVDPVELTLVPEVQARAALQGRRVRFVVLAPVGGWLGVGTLRVLRAIERDDLVELVCGYESYARSGA
ncbi:MAG: hypothetical protein KGN02_09935 [bacterium]|nr:hypothetical protein [bacterium]